VKKLAILPIASTVLGVVALGLAIWGGIVSSQNRETRQLVVERQQQLANGQAIAQVNTAVQQLLMRAAAETGDQDIVLLLQANGVAFVPPSGPAPGPAPRPAPAPQQPAKE
jgi:hypothetical protein